MGRVIDLYALLGVKRDASPVELDKAFRKKAKELHPDKGGTAEAFKQLSQAIRVLRDPDKRAHYDRGGAFGENDTATRPDPAIDLVKIEVEGLIAAFLGIGPAILALFAGVMSACVYAVVLLARGRASAATRLPFGSFLAAGGLFAALFGDRILNAYMGLLR